MGIPTTCGQLLWSASSTNRTVRRRRQSPDLTERAGARRLETAAFILVNSDGCGVFVTQWGRMVSGCTGLHPSESVSGALQHGTRLPRSLADRGGQSFTITGDKSRL